MAAASGSVKEIGIISDTHGFLDPLVFEAFDNCDEIWHAGDFGDVEICKQLADFKPFRGVYGNIDGADVRLKHSEVERFEIDGVDILMIHIGGRPGRYSTKARNLLNESTPDVLVTGHSHILQVERDERYKNMRFINPGAAGHEGAHVMRTLLKAQIVDGQMKNLRLIELGPRGRREKATNL